ncbi:MAG: hypothetical protein HY543_07305 [Deltaproteobacteria bacterium]|nr:hypothetical protein [Deltaproteobacteria bacterium]
MRLTSMPRRWTEVGLLALLLGLLAIFAALNLKAERRLVHQKGLFFELQILRSAVNLYKVVNRKNPPTLVALAMETYQLPGDGVTRRFLEGSPIDTDGTIRDPFGHVYHYDAETGWVRSSANGYTFW